MLKKSRPYTVSVALNADEKEQLMELTEYFQKKKGKEITKSDIIRVALKRYYTVYLDWRNQHE